MAARVAIPAGRRPRQRVRRCPVWFSGGKFAPDLTLPKLRHRWDPAHATPPRPFTTAVQGVPPGIAAAVEAELPVRLNIVVTDVSAAETNAMVVLAEDWGLAHNVYTNMTPTIYSGGESLLAQSAEHLRTRKAFTRCNAGHTFFHADPHGRVSICKVGRHDQIDLMREGLDGLRRLGDIADSLMLRTGGCSGCQLAGTCRVCRPLAKQFQEAKAPLASYCQHQDKDRRSA